MDESDTGKEQNEVRIVRLEPMRVASARGFGACPEAQAWSTLRKWSEERGLASQGHRFFGFNNPEPEPDRPEYGYEQWITVDAGETGSACVEIKGFGGGLYAVLRCQGVQAIGDTWQRLMAWCESTGRHPAGHQWVEECLTPDAVISAPQTCVFDLYLPIAG